jgi:NAD(P)-dependent dehydrogenase (short-subunit alcohol dehydrogenase family)/acyl carrier protein
VLEPFERNLSFTTVDVDRLRVRRPHVFQRIAAEVLERLASGAYRPLPTAGHPLSALAEAFSAAARPESADRVLVELGGAAQARPRRPKFAVRADVTYLITGGFGAFGLATARWLASEGARHIVLVGRRGASSPSAKAQVEALSAAGVEVTEDLADITDRGQVERLVTETIAELPPLRGVFHAAGVLDDRPLEDITSEQLRRVLAPKTRGALNLHAALSGAELDAFVLYSSASALVGPVPQIAYAGANAVLDALAAARHAQGLPAVSINWGALGGGGMAEASDEVERYLALLGVRPIAMDRATTLMQECLGLGGDVVAAVVVDLDWARFEAACPASAASCRFSEHVAAATAGRSGAAALRRDLSRLPAEQRREVLAYVLAEQLSEVLGIDAGGIDLAAPLTDLGVDSLMTVEFSARVHVTLGLELKALDLTVGAGLLGVADWVAEQIDGEDAPWAVLDPVADDASPSLELKKVA